MTRLSHPLAPLSLLPPPSSAPHLASRKARCQERSLWKFLTLLSVLFARLSCRSSPRRQHAESLCRASWCAPPRLSCMLFARTAHDESRSAMARELQMFSFLYFRHIERAVVSQRNSCKQAWRKRFGSSSIDGLSQPVTHPSVS